MESSSAYIEEDITHSLDDTYKLVDEMASTLKMELQEMAQVSATTAYQRAVYGIQCIRNQTTLLKTTLGSDHKWHVIQLRSATVPCSWDECPHFIKFCELMICLYR
ncbi:hypothetical protein O0I10_004436 [Lichtheimia ornata]|uniref:Uncharacterized protein n=1 Tax=Lichtheimia ornata TaxID=688661 RepID=A0AAD7Y0I1_9FUNG|nr:uncharacterized protein O0I10_004436 [Lichtheimia ornata]KAJ8659843.1 hypothetical protein O0I10_004436 [Lichtheimia ornata]